MYVTYLFIITRTIISSFFPRIAISFLCAKYFETVVCFSAKLRRRIVFLDVVIILCPIIYLVCWHCHAAFTLTLLCSSLLLMCNVHNYFPTQLSCIILVSASSSCFTLTVLMREVSCVGYTPRAWNPRPLYAMLNGLLYFDLWTTRIA